MSERDAPDQGDAAGPPRQRPRSRAADWLRRRVGHRFPLVARLAWDDYRHEWLVSGFSVLALAAVLIPLLVLFGLKYGIITNLLDPLTENPRYREIAPITSGHYTPEWFASMSARSDVAFLVPRTRSLAASIKLLAPGSDVGRIIDVELIPSGDGDPALEAADDEDIGSPEGHGEVVLSASAAEKLGVGPGGRVEGVVTRTRQDRLETVRLPLAVAGVAPPTAFTRDGVFVSHDLLVAVEDFLDGRAVPELDWEGSAPRPADRAFAGFRMYARELGDVAGLRAELLRQNVDVRTSIADISLVQTLDRNLGIVYWIIAAISIVGYCMSFATSVWANVDRKRREFSVLRLTGFRTGDIVWFPILQAAFTALLAWLLAALVFFAVQGLLNALFAPTIGGGEPVARLRAWHLGAALLLTTAAAIAAALVGGRRVAQLEPSIGLRDN
ncbi:MAG: FtsX-like permease family protein [Gammaproteobacteria bacterium]|nr:FtsX-like permease family protein [Gammaproteobacteria bacterium]